MLTDVRAADEVMSLLSELLRMSLASDESDVTTLAGELQFVDAYLRIESIRFEDRLRIVREIAPETLDALVPHLLLQPIVENAVRHGIGRLPAGGRIGIGSSRQGRYLCLRVTDNGPGLAAAPSGSLHAGLGLRATQERLRTLYGEDQELDVRATDGGGVDVRLRIPLTLDTAGARVARYRESSEFA